MKFDAIIVEGNLALFIKIKIAMLSELLDFKLEKHSLGHCFQQWRPTQAAQMSTKYFMVH